MRHEEKTYDEKLVVMDNDYTRTYRVDKRSVREFTGGFELVVKQRFTEWLQESHAINPIGHSVEVVRVVGDGHVDYVVSYKRREIVWEVKELS